MSREIDWDRIAVLYADRSITLREIARRCRVNVGQISRQARLEGWPPRQRKRNQLRRETKIQALTERMFRALDRQMHEMEIRLMSEETEKAERSATERERDARTLGALTRTLQKLRDLEREAAEAVQAARDKVAADDADETSGTDGVREDLERRLDRLMAGAGAGGLSEQSD